MMRQQQVVLQLAQQGNPQAIAMCMNYKLKPFGITAQARVQTGCLHILLESDKSLNKEKLTSFIVQFVFRLHLASHTSIKALVVYGKKTDTNKLLWKQQKLLPRQESTVAMSQHPQPHLQQMAQQRIAKMVVDKTNAHQSKRIGSLATCRAMIGTTARQFEGSNDFDQTDNTIDALFAYF